MANVFSQALAAEGVSHICSLLDDGVASKANLRTSAAETKIQHQLMFSFW